MGLFSGGNALLALTAAALWGVGDFCGGLGAKQAGGTPAGALRLILLSHSASLIVLAAFAFFFHIPFPHGAPLLWGLAAGTTGGFALTAFYVALSRGAMGASAAISGLLAAAIPALVSAVIEGVPGRQHILGFAVAGAAIWMIGGSGAAPEERITSLLAIAAGAGFGLYFVELRFASPAGAVWSMATARMGSLTLCTLMLLALGRRAGAAVVTRQVVVWALGTAMFDTAGNLLFVVATRLGRLDIASVLASLYPASTILLAGIILREQPTSRQLVGMAIALVAVILVAT
ncbi:MAG: EamA family transporter [Janthinobacterium lividum]